MALSGARAAQLADQIRDYIAHWVARDFPGYLVTITQVTLSPDLRLATAWITIFNAEDEGKVLILIKKKTGEYQHALHRSLKRHTAPRLEFILDQSQAAAEQIDKLLK